MTTMVRELNGVVYIECRNGNKIRIDDDGSIEISTKNGTLIEVSREGLAVERIKTSS